MIPGILQHCMTDKIFFFDYKVKKLFLAVSLIISAQFAFGQNFTRHNWLFGNSDYGIIFNKSDDQPNQTDTQATPFGTGGSAVASDRVTGDLLFYSDGNRVYDASHALMSGWVALSGNTAGNQSVAISPRPANPDQYYIFTNTANYPAAGQVFYSTVNMALDGNATPPQPPLGAITNTNQPAIPGTVNPGMLVFETGNDPYLYFLLVQNAVTGDYELYSIGPAGQTLIKILDNPTGLVAANFSYHPQSGQIAVSPNNPGANIQILQFDLAVDTLGFVREIPNSGNFDTAGQAIYDVEFSPSGNYIFISRHGDAAQEGALYRYDLNDSLASLDLVNPAPLYRSYGLQIGPDGRIYHLYQLTNGGPILVGRIANPDASDVSGILYQAVPTGNENYNGRQFPSFSPPPPLLLNAGFEAVSATTCERSPTKFYPTFDPPAEFYSWDFGDLGSQDNTSNLVAPIHTFSGPGTFDVTLIAGFSGRVDTVIQTIQVLPMMDSIDLGQDTVICPNESLVLDAGSNWDLIRWNTGETGQQITVDSANATNYFWVVAQRGNCTAYDAINVEEYGEQTQSANYWFFGNNAGINFNEQPPVAVSDGQLIAPEGSAAISDRNGDLLFYTDGNVVYDRDHVQMDNGFQIGGSVNSSQSSIIIPFPNDETMFYIFTTRAVFDVGNEYALQYAVVDIKEIGGGTFGSVVTKEKQLFERSTERMTATNPGGFVWLITHEMGNNTFRAYPITEDGIGNPVLSSIGSVHDANNPEESQGYMKLSPDGRRLAVALTKGGRNYVEIFDFDPQTGELSNYLQIEIPTDYPQVYGVEFTGDSNKLFVTTNTPGGSGSKLYELDLFYYDKDSIESSIAELAEESGVNMGAIQTGPDGQIYVARDGQQFLGTITPVLDTLINSTYLEAGFDLVSGTSSLGLPNFIQSFFQQTPLATAIVIPGCVDQVTTFIGNGTSIIDEFLWTFGDGGTATTDSASHVYINEGIYTVSFQVTNRCGLDTVITQFVDISGYPDPATINPVEILCDGPLTLDADTTNSGDKIFIWSTGATTQAIQVTSPGIFTVEIINAAGCITQDTTQVFDGRPPVNLGPNRTICQDDDLVLDTGLPVGTPPNTFTWFINGVSQGAGTNNTFTVDTSTPGDFEFIVNVVDGLTGCVGRDTVLVTINPIPQATYTVANSTCGNDDGEITVTSPLTNLTAEYYDDSNSLLATGNPSPGLFAGFYTLTIRDNLSACAQDYGITIVDDPSGFTTTAGAPIISCTGSDIDITITSTTASPFAGGAYTLINESTQQIYETGNITNGIGNPSVTFTLTGLPGGAYTILVDAFGCAGQLAGILINDPLTADLTVDAIFDVCSDDPTISATSTTVGAVFTWTGPGGFNQTGESVQVPVSGQYQVTVSHPSGIPCDTTAIVQVNLATSPDPVIQPVTAGCDGTRQVGIANLPGGNYSYTWVNNTTSQQISNAPQITIVSSTELSLTVRDQLSGCQGEDLQQVDVYQPLTVNVTVDRQACQDNNLVTLTANVVPAQSVTYTWFLNNVLLRDETRDLPTFNQGIYRAVVTDVLSGNCSASGELQITRAPVTPSNIEPQYIICPEPPANEIALIEPGDFVTYLAFNLNSGQQIFETMPGTFEIVDEGTYNFELENEFNCWTYDTTRVIVDCVPTIFAPNAFSPNAQLIENQTFRVFPTFVGDFEIFIYNRWGELIFFSDDLDFMVNVGWDGTQNGKMLPLGTYAYVIRYRSITQPERGVLEKPGGVTIVR